MGSRGYKVDPEVLDGGAKELDDLAEDVLGAWAQLKYGGMLPTLDPISRAMSDVASPASGGGNPAAIPMFQDLAEQAGKWIAEQVDPYPDVRQAWLEALLRYVRLLIDDAKKVRSAADEYRRREDEAEQDFREREKDVPPPGGGVDRPGFEIVPIDRSTD